MQLRVAGGDDARIRSERHRSALPVRHRAAGTLDDGHQGAIVVIVHAALDGDVGMAGGDQSESVAIRAVAGEADGAAQPVQRIQVAVFVGVRRRGEEHGVGEAGPAATGRALAVQRARTAGAAGPALSAHRLVDHAEHGPIPAGEPDQGAEDGNAGDERLGAVDRVEIPDVFGVAADDAELLPGNAVVGRRRLENGPHGPLGGAVRLRDRRRVRLGGDGAGTAVVPAHDVAGGVRQPVGQLHIRVGTAVGHRRPGPARPNPRIQAPGAYGAMHMDRRPERPIRRAGAAANRSRCAGRRSRWRGPRPS